MPKRPDHLTDLMTIGVFAPVVIAARLQMLALESLRPTAKGRREALRMTSEKPAALMEGALATQRNMLDAGLRWWSDLGVAANALYLSAPAISAAYSAPVRRRVRGNARRLSGY